MFKYDEQRLNVDEVIGTGSFGQVHPYQKDPNDKKWVVKWIVAKNVDSLIKTLDEVVLGFNCHHPAIVPIRGYYIERLNKTGFQVFIKMPRMTKNLNQLITKGYKGNLSEEAIIKWLYTLLGGLEYLHKKGIVHRDVKPSNILIDEEDNIRLTDIGSAQLISEEELNNPQTQLLGTCNYMAPEFKECRQELKKQDLFLSDVWGLGISFAELCLMKQGLVMFEEPNKGNIVEKILLDIQANFSQDFTDIMKGMINVDYKQRNSVKGTLELIRSKYGKIIVKIFLEFFLFYIERRYANSM